MRYSDDGFSVIVIVLVFTLGVGTVPPPEAKSALSSAPCASLNKQGVSGDV